MALGLFAAFIGVLVVSAPAIAQTLPIEGFKIKDASGPFIGGTVGIGSYPVTIGFSGIPGSGGTLVISSEKPTVDVRRVIATGGSDSAEGTAQFIQAGIKKVEVFIYGDHEDELDAYREFRATIQGQARTRIPHELSVENQSIDAGLKSVLRVSSSLGGGGALSSGVQRVDRFAEADFVEVKAEVAEGEVFKGWSGQSVETAHCTTGTSCVVYTGSNYLADERRATLVGKFEKAPTKKLVLAKVGNGDLRFTATSPQGTILQSCTSGCVATAGHTFPEGTRIDVTAMPSAGYRLGSWSAGAFCAADATTNHCVGTLSNNVTVTATFEVDNNYQPLTFSQKGRVGTQVVPGKVTISWQTATTSGQFVCTGNECPGKPAKLPVGATVSLTMEQLTNSTNGNERYVAYAWGDACQGTAKTASCSKTVGATGLTISAIHKTEYRVTIKRSDANGSVWANTADSQAGVRCGDDTSCTPSTGSKTYWFLQDKQVNVYAEGESGYRFDRWVSGCTGASSGYCTFKNQAATINAAFREHRYRLVVSKDCDPGQHGTLIGSGGLYCGTVNLQPSLNGVLKTSCGATCMQTVIEGIRGGVDSWLVEKYPLQGSWLLSPPGCSAKEITPQNSTVYYDCVLKPYGTNGGHHVYVTDRVTGLNAYTQITELILIYRPRADYDVDPWAAYSLYGTTTPQSSVDSFDFSVPPPTVSTSVELEPVPRETTLLAAVSSAFDAMRVSLVRTLDPILARARMLLGAVIGSATPPDLSPEEVIYTPRGAGVGTSVTFAGSVANLGGTPFTGSYVNRLAVQQKVSGSWVAVFVASSTATSVPAGQYGFTEWQNAWVPTVAGEYRLRSCLTSIAGTDASSANNCAPWRYVTVGAQYAMPAPPKHTVVARSLGGGMITSTASSKDANFAGCAGACGRAFVVGTELTLTATPESGKRFVRWDGLNASECVKVNGANNTCRLTVDGFTSVTAIFAPADTLTLCGDADRSGQVLSSDSLKVMDYAVGTWSDINLKNADVNGDGKIMTSDASLILKAATGSAKLEIVGGVCTYTLL